MPILRMLLPLLAFMMADRGAAGGLRSLGKSAGMAGKFPKLAGKLAGGSTYGLPLLAGFGADYLVRGLMGGEGGGPSAANHQALQEIMAGPMPTQSANDQAFMELLQRQNVRGELAPQLEQIGLPMGGII